MNTGLPVDGSYAYTYRSACATQMPIVHDHQSAFVVDNNNKCDDASAMNTVNTDDYGGLKCAFRGGYERKPNPSHVDSATTPDVDAKVNYPSCWVTHPTAVLNLGVVVLDQSNLSWFE